MLGDRIFVAPVVEELPFRKVVLPPGAWYYANDMKRYDSTGEEEITVLCSATDLPAHFYKAGSILVKQEFCERTSTIPEKLII